MSSNVIFSLDFGGLAIDGTGTGECFQNPLQSLNNEQAPNSPVPIRTDIITL